MPECGGYSLHRWNGSDWDHVAGAAVKIAVGADESLWALNRNHQVLGNSGAGWTVLPGLAREIAIGADGSVWCLSASQMPSADSSLHLCSGSDWEHVPGAAIRIAASVSGAVWLVNADHRIFRAA